MFCPDQLTSTPVDATSSTSVSTSRILGTFSSVTGCSVNNDAAMMGSAAFLLVYAAVNAGHLKVLEATGANASIVWLSLLTCLAMFAVLCWYIYQEQPAALAVLVVIAAMSFAAEWLYRSLTGRRIRIAEHP